MPSQIASLVRTLRLVAGSGSQNDGWLPYWDGVHSILTSAPPLRALEIPERAADALQKILTIESSYHHAGLENSPISLIDWSRLTHLTVYTGRRRKCTVTRQSSDASLFSLSCLTELPSLDFLHLKEWYSPTRDKEPTMYPDFTLSSIKTLIIEGIDSTEPSIVSDVLDHCPSLLHLDICGSTSGYRSPEEQRRRIKPLFRNLARMPSGLKTLRLASGHWRLITDRNPVDLKGYTESFAHLQQLERLHLGLTCYNFRQLLLLLPKLRFLHLARPYPPYFPFLQQLIMPGPEQHPSLHHITLDLARTITYQEINVLGCLGKLFVANLEEQQQLAPRPEKDGWIRSKVDFEQIVTPLSEFLDTAEEVGVIVGGHAVEALEIYRAYEAESKKREKHNSGIRARQAELNAELQARKREVKARKREVAAQEKKIREQQSRMEAQRREAAWQRELQEKEIQQREMQRREMQQREARQREAQRQELEFKRRQLEIKAREAETRRAKEAESITKPKPKPKPKPLDQRSVNVKVEKYTPSVSQLPYEPPWHVQRILATYPT